MANPSHVCLGSVNFVHARSVSSITGNPKGVTRISRAACCPKASVTSPSHACLGTVRGVTHPSHDLVVSSITGNPNGVNGITHVVIVQNKRD